MAMSTGRRGGQVAEINMTPMIDVLLVLLIIFMVVQAGPKSGLSVQIPPPDKPEAAGSDTQLVLSVGAGPEYRLNAQPVEPARLRQTLRGVLSERTRRVLFVDGASDVAYRDVVAAIDASREAGADVVGIFRPAR